jgi:hypothetical protein
MTPKYFVEQLKRIFTRLVNVESRLPNARLKVKFNPTNTIASGAFAEIAVTVPGAVIGDAVVVSYNPLQGITYTATGNVDDDNGGVLVVVYNLDGSSRTLTGDWYVHVIK